MNFLSKGRKRKSEDLSCKPFTESGVYDDEVTLEFGELGEEKLYVSKNFLCMTSPVFEAMFTHNFIEKNRKRVKMTDKSYDDFLDFLMCIHPRDPQPLQGSYVGWYFMYREGRLLFIYWHYGLSNILTNTGLQRNFLPFVKEIYSNGFKLYQDNDSKHCSKSTKEWLEKRNIPHCVMKTPVSSPDLNLIENVWSSIKDFLQRRIKLKRKEE